MVGRLGRVVRCAALALAACGGGGGSSTTEEDAAPDSAPEVGVLESGDCFPFCASGDDSEGPVDAEGDGAQTCAQLQAAYEAYELTAKACDPQLPGQCSSTALDPCCPVTVGSDQSSVDDFSRSVVQYEEQCTPDCSRRLCGNAPSNACLSASGGSPASGVCM